MALMFWIMPAAVMFGVSAVLIAETAFSEGYRATIITNVCSYKGSTFGVR